MTKDRFSTWVHLVGTLVTLAAVVLEPRLVLSALVWTLAWVAVFAVTLWAGLSLASGQSTGRGPRLGHEGFAALVLGFFVLSEGVPLIWLATWLHPSFSIWLVAGLIISGLAVLRCAWLPRQLIEERQTRRMVDNGRFDELLDHIRRRPAPRATVLMLNAAHLLLRRRRWRDAATLLGEFPPDPELRLHLRERWAVLAFRAETTAGDLAAAAEVLRREEVPDTPAVRGARLWLAALEGRGEEVLQSLDGPERPRDLDARLELVLRAHALAAIDRADDARAVLQRLGPALEDVREPKGPASSLAREMGNCDEPTAAG